MRGSGQVNVNLFTASTRKQSDKLYYLYSILSSYSSYTYFAFPLLCKESKGYYYN